ncbi:hypothetical protein DXB65_09520 [Bacteroides oleiciplenus]|uniref:HTH luxR-type domain-containing protein n=2 Tax=Bacteroides oleiciplenus TaxID=626931 RepID=A0A3E5BGA2_9BACE|nr:hypothetical protein DXB65_09520 [Bacteroides oleiciplenus]
MVYKTLFCYLCSMKNAFFIYLCIFLLHQSVYGGNPYRWEPIETSFDSLGKQLEQINYKSNERMQFYPLVTRMYQIANLKKNTNLQVRAMYWDAWLQFETNTEETEKLIEKALEKVDSIKYSYDYARINFVKGMLLAKHNNYPQAFRTFKKQENYFKAINDLYSLGYTYVNIGSIMRRIGEYQEGNKYYLQATEIFKKGGFIEDEIKNRHNIGVSQYHLGDPQKAVEMLTTLLDDKITQEDLPFRTDVLTSLYFVSQTLPDKEKYAREAYKTAQQITNKTSQTYTLINMGALYIYKNEKDSALFYFQKARHSAEANKDAYSAIHTLYGLAEIYDRKDLPDSAYQYLKRYLQYKEETTGFAKSNEINRYEMKMAIEQYENELLEASERIQMHKKITIISILIGLVVCCVIGYIFWLSRKKEKIAKLLKESENRELNERLQRQQLQNEKYQMEINLKNRELTSNSMIAIEKNQMLRGLLKQIEELEEKKKLPINESRTLKQHIKSHLDTEDEWMSFKHHFEEVHPNFFKKLCAAHPNLSENELRLCAYVRIGMEAKQIAQMLSVLPETINTSRYRIRKKMQLAQDVVLENYLREI